ncbi:hypothetical protein KC216_22085, partial [Mycobacterium tuberculosis]|uniref:hypothetical protein n=1 Tax=Mycobacterium tuberculosis TaxID=1773 RepID=UPI001B833A39
MEEDLRYREETDIESSINSLLGLNRKPSRQKKPPAVHVIVEEPESLAQTGNSGVPAGLLSPERSSNTYNSTPFA